MNTAELWFVDLGFSWVWSKLMIYLILFACFFGLSFLLFYFRKLSNYWRIPLMILISLTPVLTYFAINPIYSGDIFDESSDVKTTYVFPKNKTLNIFVLKGCPHCKNTIPFIEKLHERNEQLAIQYIIIGKNDAKYPGFTNEIPGFCSKVYEPNAMAAGIVTQGNYPCFVLSSNEKAEKRWFNDNFGMKTLDVIESYFN